MKLKGTITALITPFKDRGLDLEGLKKNIDHQLANSIDGILVLGTTGEASTLSFDEQEQVISCAIRQVNGQVPVLVGTGSYCTNQTIEKTKRAKTLGASGALIVTPYYNKPTQEGIYRHFEAISQAVDIPIMLYNIPGRCGTNMEAATILRLAALENIVGLKEASGNLAQAADVLQAISVKRPEFRVFSGDDALTLPMMALGAVGTISVVSNLIPASVAALVNSALAGDYETARKMHYKLLPIYKAAFIETNPVPIKTAMNLCGMPAGECRLPLYQMSQDNIDLLKQPLRQMQLIQN